MEASKGITTNIPVCSPLKQEYVWIPTLLSHSLLLVFSTLLSRPSLLKNLSSSFSPLFVLCFFSLHESLLLQSYFPLFSNLSFFFLFTFFSFFLGAKPLETPRIFPHAFSSPPIESLYPWFLKNPFFLSLPSVSFFFLLFSSSHQHPHHPIFFLVQLWKSSPSAQNPNSFSSPLPEVGNCPS